MEKPFTAYRGDDPYVFVCYAHEDSEIVYPEIQWLHDQGFNVWYDEGISPGSVWRDELASAIDGAALFLFFVTPQSVERLHCQREVSFAVDNELPFLAVHLEETTLDSGMQLALSSIQGIPKYETNERDYRRKLIGFASQHLQRGIASREVVRQVEGVSKRTVVIVAAITLALGAAIGGIGMMVSDGRTEAVIDQTAVTRFNVPVPDGLKQAVSSYRISGDGRRIVFQALEDGRRALYAWHLDEFDPVKIDVGDDRVYRPFFSPDGRWLGYRDTSSGNFKKVPVEGGVPVTIGPSGIAPGIFFDFGVTWGPDGIIVFSNWVHPGLQQIADTNGTPTTITHPEVGTSHRYPAFLPDGRAILYCATDSETNISRIMVFDRGTDESEMLAVGCSPHIVGPFLIYWHEQSYWAARFDRDGLAIIGDAVPVLPSQQFEFDASYSGDILYTRSTGLESKSVLVWVDDDGNEEPIDLEPSYYRTPRVSPNGQEFAFSDRTLAKPAGDIWLYSIDRERRRRLTNDSMHKQLPTWSPDGTSLIFSGYVSTDDAHLFRVPVDGLSAPVPILQKKGAYMVEDWPLENVLIYSHYTNDGGDVGVLSLDSGKDTKILKGEYTEAMADLSPNGRWLVYMSDQFGEAEIHIRPFPNVDDGWHPVSSGGGYDPIWRPDGRAIYYRRDDDVYVVDVETEPMFRVGTPRHLFTDVNYRRAGEGRSFDVAPDGRFLFLKPATDEIPPLVYVQNWLSELEERVPPSN